MQDEQCVVESSVRVCVCVACHSQFEHKKLFCLETGIRPLFRYRNVFDEARPSHPGPGRFSCFRETTLSLGMLLCLEVKCTLDVDSSFHLVLLLHQVQLSRSTVWTISGLQEAARIYVHNLAAGFPTTPRWCEDQQ